MFGILDIVEDFCDDPVGTTVEVVTQPIRDTLEVVEGLTEGELRIEAISRLGVDAALGMGSAELLEWYKSQ